MNGFDNRSLHTALQTSDVIIEILPPGEFRKSCDLLDRTTKLVITRQTTANPDNHLCWIIEHKITNDEGTMMFISKSLKKLNSSKIQKLQLLHETGKIMFEGHQRSQFLGLRKCFSVYTTRKFNIGNLKSSCSSCCNQADKFKVTDARGQTVFYVEADNLEIKITDANDGSSKATTFKTSNKVHLTFGEGDMNTFQKVLALVFVIVIYNQPGGLFTKDEKFSCKSCEKCGCYIVVAISIIFGICITIMLSLFFSPS